MFRVFPAAASQPRSRRLSIGVSVGASSGTDDRPKVALITGGNTGIGFATARALAQKGFYVVIACRDGDKALAAQAKIKCAPVPAHQYVFECEQHPSEYVWQSMRA